MKRKKKSRKFTQRQLALLRNLTKGMSVADAARKAGYSDLHPNQSGYQALQVIAKGMPEVMEKHGLTDDALIDKYLHPALEAEETEFAKFEGKITDEVNVVAWGPRLTALDLAFRLKGSYAPNKTQSELTGNPIQVMVINAIDRPQRGVIDRS